MIASVRGDKSPSDLPDHRATYKRSTPRGKKTSYHQVEDRQAICLDSQEKETIAQRPQVDASRRKFENENQDCQENH